MGAMMVEGMKAWLSEHRGTGKLEDVWSFAGIVGGGGILNVDSPEELDKIMIGFPFGQTSQVEIYPLADLDASLEATAAQMQMVAELAGNE
jgi:muconolactone delta-isomerase